MSSLNSFISILIVHEILLVDQHGSLIYLKESLRISITHPYDMYLLFSVSSMPADQVKCLEYTKENFTLHRYHRTSK